MAHILVVDDCAAQRRFYAALLSGAGHRVLLAANGRQAMRLLRDAAPDLAVTDIFMPDGDGIELIRSLRRARQRLPVVAVSGGGACVTGLPVLDFAKDLGADAAVSKAAPVRALLSAISDLLSARRRLAA